MANAWAMRPLPILGATASGTAAGHDPVYVANDYAGIVWKSPTAPGQHSITIDLGSPQQLDAICFFGCTGASASWSLFVQASDSADMSNSWASAPDMPFLAGADFPSHGRGVGFYEPPASAPSRRYWRFWINPQGSAATIARLAVGRKLTLERNFAFGAGFGVRDLGRVDWSKQGVLLRRRAAKLRTVGLSFPSAKKDEVEQKIQPLLELVAGQEQIVLCTDPAPDPQRQKRFYIGHLVGELGTVWARASGFEWRANLVDGIPIPKRAA